MSLTVSDLAKEVAGEVAGNGDTPIVNARTLSEAQPGDITFVEGDRHMNAWHASQASAAVVTADVPLNGRPLIRVPDPLAAFATIVMRIRGSKPSTASGAVDPKAMVHPSAVIGNGSTIGPFAVIGEGAIIGDDCHIHSGVSIGRDCKVGNGCVLHPHVVLYDDCQLGNRVIVHANAVIGSDGYGYRNVNGTHVKVPQLGNVEIEDDVEIGACTTIDRGTFGPTRIGRGTKIDNLVQIGHNCTIGAHNLLVSQVGIAGSCVTGDYVVMGGQVGVADHVTIGERTSIGAKAAVPKDIPAGQRMLGYPARPDKETLRILLAMEKLPELVRDVKKLKDHLDRQSRQAEMENGRAAE